MARQMSALTAWLAQHPRSGAAAQVAGLLAVFVALDRAVGVRTVLPAESYAQPWLLLEFFRQQSTAALLLLALGGAALWRFGALRSGWRELEHGIALRWFVVAMAALMAWPFSTHGYNYFFDQAHYPDRLALVALVALLWWRPGFIFALLPLLFVSMWQIAAPGLGGSVFAHKLQVLHVLNLFAAAFLIHAITGTRRTNAFVFLSCCLVGGSYWVAALAKFELDWLSFGHLYRMPLAAYAHGWLANFEPASMVAFAGLLAPLDWPLRIFVIAFEAGCLLMLWRRGLTLGLLAAAIVFHAGVFALYGFFFWTWIALDLGLLMLLARRGRFAIHGAHYFAMSLVLIALASWWCAPPRLAWLDTNLSYVYRIDAVGASGQRYTVPPTYFSPYDDIFTMTSFSYLSPHAVLTGPYGVTKDRAVADALMDPIAPARVFELEQSSSRLRRDARREAVLHRFLVRFAGNRNRHGPRAPWLQALRAPRQFWSVESEPVYRDQEPIRELVVREVTSLFDGKRLRPIRELELARLPVPGG